MITSHWDTFVYGFFFGAGWIVAGWIALTPMAIISVLIERYRDRTTK